MRLPISAVVLLMMPVAAIAVGPEPAQSTNDDSAFADSAMIERVRALADAGRYADARAVLDQMNPRDSMVQTYYGFTARKMGDLDASLTHYERALAIDPDNINARSYLGMALLESGDRDGAQAQLSENRARNGRQTWAEIALPMAIDQGTGPSY